MLAIFDISTGYQILGLLHVLAVIVAFGPLFVYGSLQRAGAGATIAKLHLRVSLPALALVWVLGMGMVGMSDEVWKMSQTWIVLSLIGWVDPDAGQLVPDPPGVDRHQRHRPEPAGRGHRRHPSAAGRDALPDDLQAGPS